MMVFLKFQINQCLILINKLANRISSNKILSKHQIHIASWTEDNPKYLTQVTETLLITQIRCHRGIQFKCNNKM